MKEKTAMVGRDNLCRQIFADGLAVLMEKGNISQVELAKATGITQTKISRYLRGKNEPKLADLASICVYFNVSPEYFLDSTMPAVPMTAPDRAADAGTLIEAKFQRDLMQILRAKILNMSPEKRNEYLKAWVTFASKIAGV